MFSHIADEKTSLDLTSYFSDRLPIPSVICTLSLRQNVKNRLEVTPKGIENKEF